MVLEFVKYIILLCSKYDIYIHVYTEEQIDHEEDNATFTVVYVSKGLTWLFSSSLYFD